MKIPEKISFRPGKLARPMARRLKETEETPSEYLRRLVADDCGVNAPAMDGHVKAIKRVNREKKRAARQQEE